MANNASAAANVSASMAEVHHYGLFVVHLLQTHCAPLEPLFTWTNVLGGPELAFTLYFPLAFHVSGVLGRRVMWAAALAEWLNGVLKWLLHGQRPYWWAGELALQPAPRQSSQTCEPGPGSPSGHCMVSGAVCLLLVHWVYTSPVAGAARRTAAFLFMLTSLATLAAARCYVAAHFPHQVLLGVALGCLLALCVIVVDVAAPRRLESARALLSAAGLMLAAAVLLKAVLLPAWDVDFQEGDWSAQLAARHCARPEWVRLDGTLYYAFARDVASLLGLCLALCLQAAWGRHLATALKMRSGWPVGVLCAGACVSADRWLAPLLRPLLRLVAADGGDALSVYGRAVLKFVLLPVVALVLVPALLSGSHALNARLRRITGLKQLSRMLSTGGGAGKRVPGPRSRATASKHKRK